MNSLLLRRRRSQPVLPTATTPNNNDKHDSPTTTTTAHPAPASTTPTSSPTTQTQTRGLLRKVSTLFSTRGRARTRTRSTPLTPLVLSGAGTGAGVGIGVGHTKDPARSGGLGSLSRYSSRSPSPPSPDIRLPDGLGPRVDDRGRRSGSGSGSGYGEEGDGGEEEEEKGLGREVSWIPFVRDPAILMFPEPRFSVGLELGLGRGRDGERDRERDRARERCLSSPTLLSRFPVPPDKLLFETRSSRRLSRLRPSTAITTTTTTKPKSKSKSKPVPANTTEDETEARYPYTPTTTSNLSRSSQTDSLEFSPIESCAYVNGPRAKSVDKDQDKDKDKHKEKATKKPPNANPKPKPKPKPKPRSIPPEITLLIATFVSPPSLPPSSPPTPVPTPAPEPDAHAAARGDLTRLACVNSHFLLAARRRLYRELDFRTLESPPPPSRSATGSPPAGGVVLGRAEKLCTVLGRVGAIARLVESVYIERWPATPSEGTQTKTKSQNSDREREFIPLLAHALAQMQSLTSLTLPSLSPLLPVLLLPPPPPPLPLPPAAATPVSVPMSPVLASPPTRRARSRTMSGAGRHVNGMGMGAGGGGGGAGVGVGGPAFRLVRLRLFDRRLGEGAEGGGGGCVGGGGGASSSSSHPASRPSRPSSVPRPGSSPGSRGSGREVNGHGNTNGNNNNNMHGHGHGSRERDGRGPPREKGPLELLFAWLRTQVDLVVLEFPALDDEPGCAALASLGLGLGFGSFGAGAGMGMGMDQAPDTSSRRRGPAPAYFLPSLTTLHAPPFLVLLLCALRAPPALPPGTRTRPTSPLKSFSLSSPKSLSSLSLSLSPISSRSHARAPSSSTHTHATHTSTPPLTRVQTHIRTPIYTQHPPLQPTALMRALRGVMELQLVFGAGVDRRSVERVVGAVGEVGGGREEGEEGGVEGEGEGELESLEVEVAWDWMDADADESLYKTVQGILPRFRTLQTLRITAAPGSRPPVIPPPPAPTPSPPILPPVPTKSSLRPRPHHSQTLYPLQKRDSEKKQKPAPKSLPKQKPPYPKDKPLPPPPLSILVPPKHNAAAVPSVYVHGPRARSDSPPLSSASSTTTPEDAEIRLGEADEGAEAFYTPREFEFALDDVGVDVVGMRIDTGAAAARAVAKRVVAQAVVVSGDGGDVRGGFKFEMGHRRRCVQEDHHELGDDDDDDVHDHDYERGHGHADEPHCPPRLPTPPLEDDQPIIPRPNYHDRDGERAQLAAWLKRCPSLQRVTFLSGSAWCFLAEGAAGGVWVNSYD